MGVYKDGTRKLGSDLRIVRAAERIFLKEFSRKPRPGETQTRQFRSAMVLAFMKILELERARIMRALGKHGDLA